MKLILILFREHLTLFLSPRIFHKKTSLGNGIGTANERFKLNETWRFWSDSRLLPLPDCIVKCPELVHRQIVYSIALTYQRCCCSQLKTAFASCPLDTRIRLNIWAECD